MLLSNILDNAVKELCVVAKINYEELRSELCNFALTYSSIIKAVDGSIMSPIHSEDEKEYSDAGIFINKKLINLFIN